MVRKPRQARSILSMARMLDAAETLFTEGGADAVTVEAVVARSDSSVGNFYARFGHRDGLLEAMHERFIERMMAVVQGAVEAAARQKTLVDVIEVYVTHMFTGVHTHRDSARFFVMHRSSDVTLRAQGVQANTSVGRVFTDLVLRYSEEFGHARPRTTADVAWRMVFAAVVQQVMFDKHEVSGTPMADRTFVREIARCVANYLRSTES